MKNNKLKILSLLVLLSCFICACASSKAAKDDGASADTNKAAASEKNQALLNHFIFMMTLCLKKIILHHPDGWAILVI